MEKSEFKLDKLIGNKKYPFLILTYESLPLEEWKEIPFGDGYFEISNLGRVRSHDRWTINKKGEKRFFKGRIYRQPFYKQYNHTVGDYIGELVCTITFCGNPFRFYVHRMVYEMFVRALSFKEDKIMILHKDRDNFNNSVENLYEGTFNDKALKIYQSKRGA